MASGALLLPGSASSIIAIHAWQPKRDRVHGVVRLGVATNSSELVGLH